MSRYHPPPVNRYHRPPVNPNNHRRSWRFRCPRSKWIQRLNGTTPSSRRHSLVRFASTTGSEWCLCHAAIHRVEVAGEGLHVGGERAMCVERRSSLCRRFSCRMFRHPPRDGNLVEYPVDEPDAAGVNCLYRGIPWPAANVLLKTGGSRTRATWRSRPVSRGSGSQTVKANTGPRGPAFEGTCTVRMRRTKPTLCFHPAG